MGAEEVCPGQRREDAGDAFALGSVAGRALDPVKIGAVGLDQGRRQGEAKEVEDNQAPHELNDIN